MKASYISVLEKQARWLNFAANSARVLNRNPSAFGSMAAVGGGTEEDASDYVAALVTYHAVLLKADAMFMNEKFCDLVDFARRDVPDDLEFEEDWMVTPNGFIVLEKPVEVPMPKEWRFNPNTRHKINAIGWMKVEMDGQTGYYFATFQGDDIYEAHGPGFSCWAHFIIKQGQKLVDRIRGFENPEAHGGYVPGRESEELHEIRWIYTALHLMAQRLTHISEHPTSPMARDMARRKKLPIAPALKVISLRRIEEIRHGQSTGETHHVDWQNQWIVDGHWRLQPYKTLGDYRWIFIEAYVKGPEDKPLKPKALKIYKVVR